MASAKALMAAAGHTLILRGTATEHAAKPNTGTATEHAAKLPKTSTATEPATRSFVENGFPEIGDPDLEKIAALLLWMSQPFQSDIKQVDIHHATLEVILKHASETGTDGALGLLSEASTAKLSALIDIMMLHKNGEPKDPNETLKFMRRIAKVREEIETQSDNATERVELDENSVGLCYRQFGRALITYDLLPHQKKDPAYRLRQDNEHDTYLSTKQRSFTDSMLHKFLGNKKVAMLIWQHGLPSVADPPVYRRGHRFDIDMLQSGLDDCLKWYSSLANAIVVHQTQEGFVENRLASSLEKPQKERQQRRREELQKAKDALWTGAALVEQRESGKRSFEDMDHAEQEMLESYETGKAEKAKQDASLPKMNPFRCELQVGMQCKVEHSAASTATEHAAKRQRRKHALLRALLQNSKKRKKSTGTECTQAAKRRKKRTATEHATASSQPDTAAPKKVQLVPRRKSKTAEVEAASAATGQAAKRRKKRRKKSTATEHAASSSQPDTAASTKVRLLPRKETKGWTDFLAAAKVEANAAKAEKAAKAAKFAEAEAAKAANAEAAKAEAAKVEAKAEAAKAAKVEAAQAEAKVMLAKAEAAKAAADKAMVEQVALQKHAKQKDEAARSAAENADEARRVAMQAAAQQAVDQVEKKLTDPDSESESATDPPSVVRECNRLASGG